MAKKDEGTGKKGIAALARELSALHNMSVKELRAKYEELFGEATASNNRDYLRKKIAWRIQELEHGGLSDRAKDRIEELLEGRPVLQFPAERAAAAALEEASAAMPAAVPATESPTAPASLEPTPAVEVPTEEHASENATTPAAELVTPTDLVARAAKPRDPRLPEAGTVIQKTHKGVQHAVKVLDDGFEYQGQRYKSLSAIAKAITGQVWNGFLFFGLAERKVRPAQAADVQATGGEGAHE